MKSEIHPKYYDSAQITCSCGNLFQTGSTSEVISVEICSKCHPFFTGQEKLIDTEGRVDRFEKRIRLAKAADEIKKERDAKRNAKQGTQHALPKSLKEMLATEKEKITSGGPSQLAFKAMQAAKNATVKK